MTADRKVFRPLDGANRSIHVFKIKHDVFCRGARIPDFFDVRVFDRRHHAPHEDLLAIFHIFQRGGGVGAEAAQLFFVGRQWMAGEVETQYFFFESQTLAFIPFWNVGQHDFVCCPGRFGTHVAEKADLTGLEVCLASRSRLNRLFQNGVDLGTLCTHRVKRSRLDECFDGGAVAIRRFDTLAEFEDVPERTVLLPFGNNGFRRAAAATLNGGQAKQDLTLRNTKVDKRVIHIGWNHFYFHALAIFEMLDQ